jgi:iron complex outermembrane recepter protein
VVKSSAVRASLVAAGTLGSLAYATVAWAQAAPASADLNEVVVTAQRRSESLQKVPISVGVVAGDELRSFQAAGDDILALSNRVPSLYAETTTGRIFPRFYIRGLGNIDFYLGASQPVSIIQDDVVLEHVVTKSNPIFDVQQVEVLRGPQGTLFGRNTTAGIIKFDSIKPTETFQGRASLSYGTFSTRTFDGGIGGPIIPGKLSFRLSALYQHRENWVDNTYRGPSADGTFSPEKDAMGGFSERDIRLQLRFTPTERLMIDGTVHTRWYEGTSTLFHRAALIKGSNSTDHDPRDKVAYDEARNNPQAYDTRGGSIKASYDFGPVTLTSITAYETLNGYSRGDTDGGAAALFGNTGFGQSMGQVRGLDQWTEELRLASATGDRLKWQVGGLYFDSRDTTDFYQRAYFLTNGTGNPNNWVRLKNANESWALFGQASYEILPDLTLTAGVRQTRDTKETRLLKTADTVTGASTYTGRRYVKLSDTEPSWDLSALYQVTPNLGVYGRVAHGFRGPTIQGRSAVFNADFTTANSETIMSYEVGVKSSLFDNKLRLNVAAFTYTVDDIQLNGNDSNGNGVLFNAAKAKAYGLEADAEWRPLPNLAISGGVSLLHSEIKDKRVYAQVCALNNVVVCTVQDPMIKVGSNYFAQIDGNPLPNAPEYAVNFAARYGIPVVDGEVFVATDWQFQGYTNFVLYKTKEFVSNGTFEGGLKLGYAPADGRYEFALFARNITNEKNLKGVIENYMAAVYNEPRIIGVSFNAKFN